MIDVNTYEYTTLTQLADDLNRSRQTVHSRLKQLKMVPEDLEHKSKLRVFCETILSPIDAIGSLVKRFDAYEQKVKGIFADQQGQINELKANVLQLQTELKQLKASLQNSHVSKPKVDYEGYVKYLLNEYDMFETTVPDKDDRDQEQYSRVLYNDLSRYTENLYTLEDFMNS